MKLGYHLSGDVWIDQLLTDTSNTDQDTVVLEFALQKSILSESSP